MSYHITLHHITLQYNTLYYIAAAKVMSFDSLGKKVRPGTILEGKSRLTAEVPKKPSAKKHINIAVTPLVLTPSVPFSEYTYISLYIYIYIQRERERERDASSHYKIKPDKIINVKMVR